MSSQQMNRSSIRRTNPRTRPYYYRRCKGGNFTTIDSLPHELLLEILTRVSAQDLHENARIVCKRWNRMINRDDFVHAHLHRTSHGLLFTTSRGVSGSSATFLAGTRGGSGGGIEELKLSCKLTSPIQCSCNGLITGMDIDKKPVLLYIVNPATKWRFDLPRLLDAAVLHSVGIGYAAASMEYKAVATYVDDPDSKDLQCAVLTVGVDKAWRRVSTQQLSFRAYMFSKTAPLITEGFMHWASWTDYVVSMNVETEVISETPAPQKSKESEAQDFYLATGQYSYLSTGRNLSAFIPCGKVLWEVWELKGETGEWSNLLLNIDCRSKIQQFGWKYDDLQPVGWVKYPEVLLFSYDRFFSYDRSYLIYDLVNDEVEDIGFRAPNVCCKPLVHKKSLTCLS